MLWGDGVGACCYAGASNSIRGNSIFWATHFSREGNSILLTEGWKSVLTRGEVGEGQNGGVA